jgi:gamma-glutamyltranspeptidase/glutathione hydrolase
MSPERFFYDYSRSPVYGRRGMAASSQPLATAAGLEILRRGGNAADAAAAVAAALNVTEPTSTGLGGDAFALFYDSKTQKVTALNGSGRCPAGLTIERIRAEGLGDGLPALHPYTITVPGACAAWCDMVERHGRLNMAEVLKPAIRLAEEGFPVAPITSWFWRNSADRLLSKSPNGCEMLIDGHGPAAGEIFRNPGLGRTMRVIADGGKQAYYLGEIAKAISDVIKQAGGCMEPEDLAAHTSTWVDPIGVNYRDVTIWECPPNGQGLAALLALNILDGYDLASITRLSAERLHLQIEAMRLAFADTRYYAADPAFVPAPLEGLLSKKYATQRSGEILAQRANPAVRHGAPQNNSDTVYFCVVDGDGNACSFINSNYMGFGTGIVPKGWGFTLQNRGHNFSLDPQHPNRLEPGKRPYHTIIPAIATRADGNLYAPFGVMGGFMQPQGHMQVACALLDDGLNPQAALNQPRFCIEPDEAGSVVSLEEGIAPDTAATLAKWGHKVRMVKGVERALFGRGQVIRRNPETGVLEGGSDPRADGCAMPLE